MTIVFPSAVIVALSWSTFFVPANLPTAKLSTALVTALSSLALEVIGRTAIAPVLKEVPYVTVIDIWMTSCLIFVIAALVIQLTVVRCAPTQKQVHCWIQTVKYITKQVLKAQILLPTFIFILFIYNFTHSVISAKNDLN